MTSLEPIKIDGREGHVMYLDEDWRPVDKAVASLAKVLFEDGGSSFFTITQQRNAARAANTPLHKAQGSAESGPPAMFARDLMAKTDFNPVLSSLRKALELTLRPALLRALVAGGDVATKGVAHRARFAELRVAAGPIKHKFNAKNPEAIMWAREHAAELVTQISETTEARIRRAITELVSGGDWNKGVDKILNAIDRDGEDIDRAERIARHETHLAASEGQRMAWEQAVDEGLLSEDMKRVWIAVGDPKVCPTCDSLDGKRAGLNEDFEDADGNEYAGPPAHVNCRCTEGIAE